MGVTSLAQAVFVTVLLNGAPLDASVQARLDAGAVVAPLDPFARAIAERIVPSADGARFTLTRGSRSIAFQIGSHVGRNAASAETFPIAPYVRAGKTIIPLASVARALGASVAYDARAHVLWIETSDEPIVTFTPVPYTAPPPGTVPTFAPTSTPAPRPTVTGIPKPRRTPILVEPNVLP